MIQHHGYTKYTQDGCRCPECKAAANTYYRNKVVPRRQKRLELSLKNRAENNVFEKLVILAQQGKSGAISSYELTGEREKVIGAGGSK